MTEDHAHELAKRRSNQFPKETYFVVYESGEYEIGTYYELETYYNGLAQDNVLAAYKNGELLK